MTASTVELVPLVLQPGGSGLGSREREGLPVALHRSQPKGARDGQSVGLALGGHHDTRGELCEPHRSSPSASTPAPRWRTKGPACESRDTGGRHIYGRRNQEGMCPPACLIRALHHLCPC